MNSTFTKMWAEPALSTMMVITLGELGSSLGTRLESKLLLESPFLSVLTTCLKLAVGRCNARKRMFHLLIMILFF